MALGEKNVGPKRSKQGCGSVSKGGLRGFWRQGRLGVTKMLLIVFTIVGGWSRKTLKMCGVKVNKNTWTKYIKDVGMVCAESLEKNRRYVFKKYVNAQWDETAFDKRKYHRGSRRGKHSAVGPHHGDLRRGERIIVNLAIG